MTPTSSLFRSRRIRSALLACLCAALVACASIDDPLATPDEPHGILTTQAPPAGLQLVRISYIDSRRLGERQTYWVRPGRHTVRVQLLSGDFARSLVHGERGGEPQSSIEIDVEAGHRYFLAGEVTGRREWRVTVWKVEP
jgi:hypothetical protein